MRIVFVVFSFFILSACEGGLASILGLTAPDVVVPEFVLDVATDNASIRLSVNGGSFDRLDMSYCGSGAIDEGSKCSLLTTIIDNTGTFLFTQSNVLDYESKNNALQSKAIPGAESSGGSTNSLTGSTTYNFQLDAVAVNRNTKIGDAETVKVSATTYNTDNVLLANVVYANVSHSLTSFDASFNLIDAIRSNQKSSSNNKVFNYVFDNFLVGQAYSENRSDNPFGLYQAGQTCERMSGSIRVNGQYYGRNNVYFVCEKRVDVLVRLQGRHVWTYEATNTEAIRSFTAGVLCTYTRPENYIQALEPLLTNSAINAGIIGGNERRFYGHNVSSIDTTISFIDEENTKPDTEITLNENIAFALDDAGDNVFSFSSMYTDTEDNNQVSFIGSGNLFFSSNTPITISCQATGREAQEVRVNINPSTMYTDLSVHNRKNIRTLTYRIPISIGFTKPSSATYGVLPTSYSGFPVRISASNTNYLSYSFYTTLSNATVENLEYLNLPSSLFDSALPVVSQHGEEVLYRVNIVEQYRVE